MRTTAILFAVAACSLAMTACTASSPAPASRPTAGAVGSATAGMGATPTISPSDPAYEENGAPRAGQASGVDTAGAPSPSGNYAPIQHEHERGGSSFMR